MEERDQVRVNFLMDRTEYEKLQQLAKQRGLSVSQVLRFMANAFVLKEAKVLFRETIIDEKQE